MDNDDAIIGKIYSRRRALQMLGLSGAALTLGGRSPVEAAATQNVTNLSCVVRPSATEGPFWVDEQLKRSDVRSDSKTGNVSAGLPLTLTVQVAQYAASGCTNLGGAVVDIWQCDAAGKYSDEQSEGTAGQDFLRGYQMTDSAGKVKFTTIYPGWYNGRTVHVHFRIRTLDASGNVKSTFTSQLFFPDSVSDKVFAAAPYSTRGQRNVRNSNDGIYQNTGDSMLLDVTGNAAKGYTGTFVVGLNL